MFLAFFVREQANKCPEDDWTAELLLPEENFDTSFFTIEGCSCFRFSQRLFHSSPHSPGGCVPFQGYLSVHAKERSHKYKAVPWNSGALGAG